MNGERGKQAHQREHEQNRSQYERSPAGTLVQFAVGLDDNVICPMHAKRNQRDYARQHRVPVQHARIRADVPVGP